MLAHFFSQSFRLPSFRMNYVSIIAQRQRLGQLRHSRSDDLNFTCPNLTEKKKRTNWNYYKHWKWHGIPFIQLAIELVCPVETSPVPACAVVIHPPTTHCCEEPSSITPLQVPGAAVGCPQCHLVSRLSQSWNHSLPLQSNCSSPDWTAVPPLNSLQFTGSFPMFGVPNLGAVLQMQFNKSGKMWKKFRHQDEKQKRMRECQSVPLSDYSAIIHIVIAAPRPYYNCNQLLHSS